MMQIYGASDDLIEIDGDWEEEIGCYGIEEGGGGHLACSDGTLIHVTRDDIGIWRFHCVVAGSSPFRSAPPKSGELTERVTLDGSIGWVVLVADEQWLARPQPAAGKQT